MTDSDKGREVTGSTALRFRSKLFDPPSNQAGTAAFRLEAAASPHECRPNARGFFTNAAQRRNFTPTPRDDAIGGDLKS